MPDSQNLTCCAKRRKSLGEKRDSAAGERQPAAAHRGTADSLDRFGAESRRDGRMMVSFSRSKRRFRFTANADGFTGTPLLPAVGSSTGISFLPSWYSARQ